MKKTSSTKKRQKTFGLVDSLAYSASLADEQTWPILLFSQARCHLMLTLMTGAMVFTFLGSVMSTASSVRWYFTLP